MISSTALDLPDHRGGIRDACERAGFDPHMMEKLPALDADAIEASLRLVDEAEVYVGIFAYRYGYVPDGHDISITEMEYDRAVERDLPRLIFFIHEDHPVTGKVVETGPGAAKLKALKERIAKQRVAGFFKSPGELRGEVIAALTTLAKELDTAAAGGDAVASTVAKLHRKTSIPAPPEPYIAHPYTLLQSRDLVGRQAELNALTDWVANPTSAAFAARVFCFVAIGGMGKSALTWKWFNQIAPNEMKPLAGRLWWSFYESDASFENFLIRALCYVGGEGEDAVRALPWPEREAQLLRHLNEKPYLFVLDGLERILIAYHRMDASYLADDEYDEQTANRVVGAVGLPASAAQSFVGQHRLRQTTDPRAGAFLQKLAQVAKSRIVVTTRLYPSELQISTGHPRPGCFAYFLRGLSDDDALGLWRALNVKGARAELVPIFRSVEGHPLLVQALASEVANYKRVPGDFGKWRADHPQFDPTSLPLLQSRTHILEFALKGLSAKVREVLHTLVGFRMPTSYATLEALLVGPDKACGAAKDLDRALTELEDRGLIGWDREANRYDAHPIVRGVVWQLAGAENQRAVYTALEAHFEPMARPEWLKVETLADLTPAIERYHTLVGLGRYDHALALFYDRLSNATLYRLAAHRERIAWLERLFPYGAGSLPTLTSDKARGDALNSLAISYKVSGQPGRAAPLYRQASEINERQHNDNTWGLNLSNLGMALFETGALHEAECVMRQALLLSRKLKDRKEAIRLQNLGQLLGLKGNHLLGEIALSRSRHLLMKQRDRHFEGVTTAHLAELSCRFGDIVKANAWAERAWDLAAVDRGEQNFIHAALMQSRVALCLGDLARADERLHHALTRARAVNLVELELPALIAIAELTLRQGRPTESRAQLEDVWEAAERGPYPRHQADAYNVLADIALAEGDKPAAIAAATKAYRAAWCDGPPYAYHWGLTKAKAHLAALGASEPAMPPFDESKFEPMPEVEINPKDEYWVDPDKLE
jgi:tetratricopeptide (TPR) repeat protein